MEDKREYLFGPHNEKDLKRQYPELGNIEEFAKLTTGELLFVWWFSNPTSPLVKDTNMPEKLRVSHAYTESFKSHPNEKRKVEYFSLNFPDRIRLAIDRMRKFEPSIRIRSKNIAETILKNFETMATVDLKDFETQDEKGNKEINWTGRNNYVTSAKTIIATLPEVIKQVEEGFGVRNEDGNADSHISKAIHRFHNTQTD